MAVVRRFMGATVAKHSTEEKKPGAVVDKRRKDVLEKFFGLTDKMMEHLAWSITATKPCTTCNTEGKVVVYKNGEVVSEDTCRFCDGTKKIKDVDQRNWATEQIGDRAAPKVKAVETTDKVEERKEFEKDFSPLTTAQLKEKIKALEVV